MVSWEATTITSRQAASEPGTTMRVYVGDPDNLCLLWPLFRTFVHITCNTCNWIKECKRAKKRRRKSWIKYLKQKGSEQTNQWDILFMTCQLVLSKCISWPECLFTIVAEDNQSLQAICLNVLYNLNPKAFLSDYFSWKDLSWKSSFLIDMLLSGIRQLSIFMLSVDLISRYQRWSKNCNLFYS